MASSCSKQVKFTSFVIVAVTLYYFFSRNFRPIHDKLQLLDCSSFYASDLIGCEKQNTTMKVSEIDSAKEGKNSSKVAIIIDNRIQHSSKFFSVLVHISGILGPEWPIQVYTNEDGIEAFSTSYKMKQEVNSGRISLFAIPSGVTFPNVDEYSAFMTSRWIWDAVAPAENILVFQADSILCANAPKGVDDFLDWDFIGAPIDPAYGHGYNGGLSMRKRSSMIRIIERFNWEDSRPKFEDQWYYERLLELQEEDSIGNKIATIRLPPVDIAKTFAVETIDYPYPVGLHQPRRFLKNEEVNIDEYCPEYKLCMKYGDT